MTNSKKFEAGHGYTQEDWDAVDSPELTAEQIASAKPFGEVFPDLAESIKRSRGRPVLDNPKKVVTIRLDADLYQRLKASGPGWQSRVNDALRKTVGL